MVIYIDPPQWPAHGTVFSHLISDRSSEELHAFAAGLGLSSRAFDEDHYDVHVERYADAVRAGAVEVTGRELIRILRRSGLRVPARERIASTRGPLVERWEHLAPGREGLLAELLDRWSEPHRTYHTPVHLLSCLSALDALSLRETGEGPSAAVRLAAWFHDAVYEGQPGSDEEASADLARERLGGDLGDEVSRLVILTKDHSATSGDLDGRLLIDADLSILGASRDGYRRYVHRVRAEYGHVTDVQWRRGRAAVVHSLLVRENLYLTVAGREQWQAVAKDNLARELESLDRRP